MDPLLESQGKGHTSAEHREDAASCPSALPDYEPWQQGLCVFTLFSQEPVEDPERTNI